MPKRAVIINSNDEITFLQYVPSGYYVAKQTIRVKKERLIDAKDRIIPVNFQFTNEGIQPLSFDNRVDAARHTVQTLRTYMVENYGHEQELTGKCIEAAELLVKMLRANGVFDARSVSGFCRFEKTGEYAHHTWTEIYSPAFETEPTHFWYADVTAEQFNDMMRPENQYPQTILQPGLPANMYYEKED